MGRGYSVPDKILCPDCKRICRRVYSRQHSFSFECSNSECEIVDFKYNTLVGYYLIRRESRYDLEKEPLNIEPFHREGSVICLTCGKEAHRILYNGSNHRSYEYVCITKLCPVSHLSYNKDNKLRVLSNKKWYVDEQQRKIKTMEYISGATAITGELMGYE